MGTEQGKASGGGFISKLIVIALLALTIALYLRIVMVDETTGGATQTAAGPQASVRVVEGDEPAPGAEPMEDLPADQMTLILQVFAPELEER